MGKTALAVYWAHKVADLFPDGQLYVNLRGYDAGPPVAAADVLARFLRALGVLGQDIPSEPDERVAQYRSLLAGRRMLVVLDNASAADQVRPLLPVGAACVTVVTSRDVLAGLVARDGAARLDLDLLPLADATSLLRALIGARVTAEPSATQVLATQCSRLPLALRVAAELATARLATSLTELTEELADQQQRLKLLDAGGDADTAVRAVFSWSCRQLNPPAVRMFRLAGLHPGGRLDRYAAAALGGVAVADAGDLLRVLTRASLIQTTGPDQYSMHDLLHAYASELSAAEDGPDVRREAFTRLLDHYLHTAAAAMDVLYPAERHRRPAVSAGGPADVPPMADAVRARAWLDERLDTLVAAVVRADGQGWPGHATRLAATVGRYLHTRGFYPEAITVHTAAAHAARLAGDQDAEAESLTSLGAIMVRLGRYRQAAVYLRQALALSRRGGDRPGQARVLRNLGTVSFRQGRYRQAAGHIEQALTLFRQTGDRAGEASALGNLGGIDLRQGRYREAADHIGQSLALYREIGDRRGEAYTLGNLGSVDFEQGRYRLAASQLRQSLALCREIGYREGEATALSGLGDLDRRQGRYRRAMDRYRQALALFQGTGNTSGEAAILNDLGKTLCATGQPEQARVQHHAALTLAVQIGDRYEQARAHDGIGEAHAAASEPGPARDHWHQALSLYSSFGAPEAEHVRDRLRKQAAR